MLKDVDEYGLNFNEETKSLVTKLLEEINIAVDDKYNTINAVDEVTLLERLFSKRLVHESDYLELKTSYNKLLTGFSSLTILGSIVEDGYTNIVVSVENKYKDQVRELSNKLTSVTMELDNCKNKNFSLNNEIKCLEAGCTTCKKDLESIYKKRLNEALKKHKDEMLKFERDNGDAGLLKAKIKELEATISIKETIIEAQKDDIKKLASGKKTKKEIITPGIKKSGAVTVDEVVEWIKLRNNKRSFMEIATLTGRPKSTVLRTLNGESNVTLYNDAKVIVDREYSLE